MTTKSLNIGISIALNQIVCLEAKSKYHVNADYRCGVQHSEQVNSIVCQLHRIQNNDIFIFVYLLTIMTSIIHNSDFYVVSISFTLSSIVLWSQYALHFQTIQIAIFGISIDQSMIKITTNNNKTIELMCCLDLTPSSFSNSLCV